jgi:hypothetical protein
MVKGYLVQDLKTLLFQVYFPEKVVKQITPQNRVLNYRSKQIISHENGYASGTIGPPL